VPACACESCSLREAAPGFRPGGRPPFFVSTKKGGKESDPASSALAMRGLPCAARSLQLAPNSLCSLRSRRSDKRREVRLRSVLRTQLQSPALLSSSEGGDEHQIRLAAHRQDEHRALRADAKRGLDRESLRSKRPYCSWAPWEASRSTGVWGRARKRASTTDFARLSERSGRRPRSEFCARPQTPSTAEQLALGRPPPSGRLSFGSFSLAKQRKGTALSGAHPDSASRSEQPPRQG